MSVKVGTYMEAYARWTIVAQTIKSRKGFHVSFVVYIWYNYYNGYKVIKKLPT